MKPQSRPKRWAAAVAAAQTHFAALKAKAEEMEALRAPLGEALDELRSLQEEYEEWQGNLPEGLQQSQLGEKLEAVTSIDVPDGADEDLDEVESAIDECDNAELPQGFGRD